MLIFFVANKNFMHTMFVVKFHANLFANQCEMFTIIDYCFLMSVYLYKTWIREL